MFPCFLLGDALGYVLIGVGTVKRSGVEITGRKKQEIIGIMSFCTSSSFCRALLSQSRRTDVSHVVCTSVKSICSLPWQALARQGYGSPGPWCPIAVHPQTSFQWGKGLLCKRIPADPRLFPSDLLVCAPQIWRRGFGFTWLLWGNVVRKVVSFKSRF